MPAAPLPFIRRSTFTKNNIFANYATAIHYFMTSWHIQPFVKTRERLQDMAPVMFSIHLNSGEST